MNLMDTRPKFSIIPRGRAHFVLMEIHEKHDETLYFVYWVFNNPRIILPPPPNAMISVSMGAYVTG